MGSPEYLTREQIEQLVKASEMGREIVNPTWDNNNIIFTVTLTPQAVAALSFEL